MFDLFRSRAKAVRIMLGAMLAIVALSMLLYLDSRHGNYRCGFEHRPGGCRDRQVDRHRGPRCSNN